MPNFTRDLVDAAARTEPGRLAVVELTRDGTRRDWTFGELSRTAGQLAAVLVDRGVRRGDTVLTLLGNRIELVQTVLACLRIGAAVLPCSEQLRRRDIDLRIRRAAPVLAIVDERNLDAIRHDRIHTVPFPVPAGPAESGAPPAADLEPTDPAFVLFTSGTSGEPKMITHGQRYLWGQRLQAEHWLAPRPGELVWSTAAPGWSKAARNCFIAPWLAGAAAVLQDRRFDPAERLATIREVGVNVLCMAPTEYRLIAAAGPIGALPSLRRLVTAGEALGLPALTAWREQTGLTISDGYGQTETGHLTAIPEGADAPAATMGRPLPGVRAWIDGSGELIVDPGSVPTFQLGHHGAEWHTGDQVEQDQDGWLFFRARADDVIISSGYRIGPVEVEATLMDHPAVGEVAVIGLPDADRGEVVCAVVVVRSGFLAGDTLARDLQEHVKRETAPYKYPRLIRFIEALPKTPSGKTARAQLRESIVADGR